MRPPATVDCVRKACSFFHGNGSHHTAQNRGKGRFQVCCSPHCTKPFATSPSFYLALNLARTRVLGRHFWSIVGKTDDAMGVWAILLEAVVTRAPGKSWPPLAIGVNGGRNQRVMRFELTTFTLAT